MKRISTIIFLTVFISAVTETKAQTPTGNYVPYYHQEQTNWCWAACGEMLYWAYHSGTISQCSFVAKSRDQENGSLFDCGNLSSSSSSPCSSPGTFNSPQSLYGCNGSVEAVFDAYSVASTGYGHAFSTSELSSAMSGRKMCIARWGWNGGGGHFLVVNRYKSGNVSFNNPLSGAYTWSYSTFKSANGQGNWTHTLRFNNAASYGSIYYRTTGVTPKDPQIIASGSIQSIDERTIAPDMSINVYPNPTVDQVTVMMNTNRTMSSQLIITNTTGQVMFSQQVAAKSNYVKLDVSRWARGVYTIRLAGTNSVKQLVVR